MVRPAEELWDKLQQQRPAGSSRDVSVVRDGVQGHPAGLSGERGLGLPTSCAGGSGPGGHQQPGWGWELAGRAQMLSPAPSLSPGCASSGQLYWGRGPRCLRFLVPPSLMRGAVASPSRGEH